MTIIGVVGDSHVPDRVKSLPDGLQDQLGNCESILHTGDLSAHSVLKTFEGIAPVYAVRGNRDWFIDRMPSEIYLNVNGKRLVLTHGHGGLFAYLKEKVRYHTVGFDFENVLSYLEDRYTDVDIVVFGHTHYPVCEFRKGVLFFNPGSVGPMFQPIGTGPKIGRLFIEKDSVRGDIIELPSGRVLKSCDSKELG